MIVPVLSMARHKGRMRPYRVRVLAYPRKVSVAKFTDWGALMGRFRPIATVRTRVASSHRLRDGVARRHDSGRARPRSLDGGSGKATSGAVTFVQPSRSCRGGPAAARAGDVASVGVLR